MTKRFLYCWFRHFATDCIVRSQPELANQPVVLAASIHGRMIVTALNQVAQDKGILLHMTVADARLLLPDVNVQEERAGLTGRMLRKAALWCIRYTPVVALDDTDGLIFDISGCAHLWGGEEAYFKTIIYSLRAKGFDVRGSIADTIGAAWANAHYGREQPIIKSGEQRNALAPLSPAALRLDHIMLDQLRQLGLHRIGNLACIERRPLRRRFGDGMLLRLDQAFGEKEELITPILPVETFEERLPCLEPIRTAGGIEIALTRLLDTLCGRLQKKGKGLREAVFNAYRVDGKIEQISIGSSRASANADHLFRLLAEKIGTMEPDLGFEVFSLTAPKVEDANAGQEVLWGRSRGLEDSALPDLVDRIVNVVGEKNAVKRYLPAAHYWPERSIRLAVSIQEKSNINWQEAEDMPAFVLQQPQPIEVAAALPDYPPMLFRYRGRVISIVKADGPERIANEWWIDASSYRDYYALEDNDGARYWVFRLGEHTGTAVRQWFLQGFFA